MCDVQPGDMDDESMYGVLGGVGSGRAVAAVLPGGDEADGDGEHGGDEEGGVPVFPRVEA